MMAWELNRSPLSCSDGPSSSLTRLSWSPNVGDDLVQAGVTALGRAASSSSSRITALSRIDRNPDVITKIGRAAVVEQRQLGLGRDLLAAHDLGVSERDQALAHPDPDAERHRSSAQSSTSRPSASASSLSSSISSSMSSARASMCAASTSIGSGASRFVVVGHVAVLSSHLELELPTTATRAGGKSTATPARPTTSRRRTTARSSSTRSSATPLRAPVCDPTVRSPPTACRPRRVVTVSGTGTNRSLTRQHTRSAAGGDAGNRTRVQGFAGPCLNHSATSPR